MASVGISTELEQKLVQACTEGDLEASRTSVLELQTRCVLSAEPVQELVGYAFSCAAAHNQVAIMSMLLYPAGTKDSASTNSGVPLAKDIHECLLYGMCRWEKYFPRRPRFQCCYAVRYLAYAAIVCVEQNSLLALEFLVQHPTPPTPALLVDTDVVRCFRLALELGSDFQAPAPEAYRPMLILLLHRYSMLLLPHVDGKHDPDLDGSVDGITREHMEALSASLMYEYVTNPQLQTPIT
ncbi:hypothetical protein PRNP1_000072 [Phytophthora ramorum]